MSFGILKKEKKYRNLWIKNELTLLSYNYLVHSAAVQNSLRIALFINKSKKSLRFSRTRLVNYCILSGNPRWVFRKLHYSRQELKKAAIIGILMGIRKLSW